MTELEFMQRLRADARQGARAREDAQAHPAGGLYLDWRNERAAALAGMIREHDGFLAAPDRRGPVA